jgi:GLPGLI family protein
MNSKFSLLLVLLTVQFISISSKAQHKNYLTIVYDITVNKTKKASGIEETYNGGTKAVFVTNKKARIRLVSLMRIQSIYFDYDTSTLKQAVLIKESGQKKYRSNLSAEDWNNYNSKYDSVVCEMQNDSMEIVGYKCRKASINLVSGETIETYFTDSIQPINNFIEPAFRCIPGTVLQYQLHSNRGLITFKASQVSRETVAKDVFVIPKTGVQARKYVPNKKNED